MLRSRHDPVVAALVNVAKAVDDLHRRQAATILSGTVHEVDGNRLRLKLGETDSRTGKEFLSPWVQRQELAGGSASNMPVKVGDPMRLLSPNGEIGAQSLAIRDSHTDEKQNPEQDKEFVLTHDGATLRMNGSGIVLDVGGSSLSIKGGEVKVTSGVLKHNSKNVGDSHVHTGVMPGPATSGPPQ
jgi:GpV Apex motif